MNKYTEIDFYKPIIKYFENVISKDYSIDLYIHETNRSLPKEILSLYPNLLNVSNTYNYFPDIIAIDKTNNNNLWIIEVKDDPLKIEDLYQTKRYSEISGAHKSFLISPYYFNNKDEQLIKNPENYDIKKIYKKQNNSLTSSTIIIGTISYEIINDEITINSIYFDEDLTNE